MQLTTSNIALFQTTKSEREAFVQHIVEQVKQGGVNPLNLHLQLKSMEDIIEQVKADTTYKDAVLTEAEKYGKAFDYQQAKIAIREVGTKYDYSQTGDDILNQLEAEKKAIDAKIKERQKLLQNLPQNGMADPETGAMLYPASKTSTTSVVITLK